MEKMRLAGDRPVFVTSDTHFGHRNILSFCPDTRRGADAHVMNDLMVDAWNSVVSEDAIVLHLGDVALGNPKRAVEVVSRLNGEIHLMMGNHDFADKMEKMGFASMQDGLKVVSPWGDFQAIHYPMEDWDVRYLHLHGHTHGQIPSTGLRFDVGVDARHDNTMAPHLLSEVATMMGEMRAAGNLGTMLGAQRFLRHNC